MRPSNISNTGVDNGTSATVVVLFCTGVHVSSMELASCQNTVECAVHVELVLILEIARGSVHCNI
jgi:hypothetical protein